MPVQTNKKANVYFPDGAKVQVKTAQDTEWFDVGAINSAVTATLNWTESTVETANAGQLDTKVSKMEIAGGFTLINLDPEGVQKLGGGVFTVETTTGTAISTPANQVLANPNKGLAYPLTLADSNGKEYKFSTTPVITSVTAGSTALTVDEDYTVVAQNGGYAIVFTAAHTTADVTIVYGSNTPIARTVMYSGSSTIVLAPYAMKIVHTDDNGKERSLELFAVYSNSGGFQFNFKGANEDGVEEMPLTFTARLDTSLVNGKQLMAWGVDYNAA